MYRCFKIKSLSEIYLCWILLFCLYIIWFQPNVRKGIPIGRITFMKLLTRTHWHFWSILLSFFTKVARVSKESKMNKFKSQWLLLWNSTRFWIKKETDLHWNLIIETPFLKAFLLFYLVTKSGENQNLTFTQLLHLDSRVHLYFFVKNCKKYWMVLFWKFIFDHCMYVLLNAFFFC